MTINKEPTPVTGDWIECSDGSDKKCIFTDSQSLFMRKKHESGESSKDPDANSLKSVMPGLMEVISFDNLYATGENNENGNVNESKDSFVREAVEKFIQNRPNNKKGTPSRSKNHDSVKSIEESTSPVGSAKEDAKSAADDEWECSLAKIKENMGNSGKSVDENIPPIGTHEEHVKRKQMVNGNVI